MRLVVMGTGPFAVPMFEALLGSSHSVAALVTRPVPPARDRQKTPPNPMRDVAVARGLPVLEPASINDPEFLPELTRLAADLFVVCDYGQILKPAVLQATPLGGINLHASLLPRYRGAAPINWAIYHGEHETGVSVIQMTPRLDGGPILAVRRTPIGPEETAVELEARLARLGIEPVLDAIELLNSWNRTSALGQPQDPALATLAPRLKKADGLVNWTRPAQALANQVRAFQPWPATFTFLPQPGKEPLRLILEVVRVLSDQRDLSGVPGTVLPGPDGELTVATGAGVLSLVRVQPSGKRSMSSREFLNGYRTLPGTCLG